MDRARRLHPDVLQEYIDTCEEIKRKLRASRKVKNKVMVRYAGEFGKAATYAMKKDIEFYSNAIRNHYDSIGEVEIEIPPICVKVKDLIIHLKNNEGYSYEEIGKVIGVTDTTVTAILTRRKPSRVFVWNAEEYYDNLQGLLQKKVAS